MSRNIFYFHKKIPAHFCTRIFKSFLLETNPLLPLSFASFQVGERVPYHYAIRFIRYVPDLTGIACFHLLYTYTSVFRKLLSRVVGSFLILPQVHVDFCTGRLFVFVTQSSNCCSNRTGGQCVCPDITVTLLLIGETFFREGLFALGTYFTSLPKAMRRPRSYRGL